MNKLKTKITGWLSPNLRVNREKADKNHLAYVYVESSSHFSEEEMGYISKAFQSEGHLQLIALAMEDLDIPKTRHYSSGPEGIAAFDNETALLIMCCLLKMANALSFVPLKTIILSVAPLHL